jgi:hypothetical protein
VRQCLDDQVTVLGVALSVESKGYLQRKYSEQLQGVYVGQGVSAAAPLLCWWGRITPRLGMGQGDGLGICVTWEKAVPYSRMGKVTGIGVCR